MQRLVGTSTTPCDHRWRSRFSGDELTKEKLTHQVVSSMQSHLPLSGSGGPGSVVHFQRPTSLLPPLTGNAGEIPTHGDVMDVMKNISEPLRLRGASRCASRGMNHLSRQTTFPHVD